MITCRVSRVDAPSLATTALSPEEQTKLTLLQASLEAAVPIWCERIAYWADEFREERRRACSQAVAEHGDMILYRSKKRGETAEAFNRLAEGIAIASLAPGGIKLFGLRFTAEEA